MLSFWTSGDWTPVAHDNQCPLLKPHHSLCVSWQVNTEGDVKLQIKPADPMAYDVEEMRAELDRMEQDNDPTLCVYSKAVPATSGSISIPHHA